LKEIKIALSGETAAQSPLLAMAGRIARSHHERWDGKGYPRGLARDAIPLEGRITSVADVFDALTSERPYKPAYTPTRALELMEEGRGTQFDPTILDALLRRIDDVLKVHSEQADTQVLAAA
jgi:putative two-component system response regulator